MRILLPMGLNINALKVWHIDNGIHPYDFNLRITRCGLRYLYGGPLGSQILRHFECPECR
jgi:hypothetical protein